MVVILIHWLIKSNEIENFKASWHKMDLQGKPGFYREILTELSNAEEDDQFHTFSLGDPFYKTFINIGFWETVDHFREAIIDFIPSVSDIFEEKGEKKYNVTLRAYEFKQRERSVLSIVSQRGGKLPQVEESSN